MSDVDRMHDGAFGVRRPENAMGLAEALQRQGAFTQASQLRAEVASLALEREDLAKRLGATQLRLGVVLNEKGDLEGDLARVRRQRDELRARQNGIHRLRQELEGARARIEQLGRQEDQLKARIVEYRDANHAYAEHNMELIRAGVAKAQRIAELKGRNEALSCDLIKANVRVEELERHEAALLATQGESAQLMETQDERIDKLRAELVGALVVAEELRIEAGRRERKEAEAYQQLQDRQRQLLDQGTSLVHAQAENRAIRSLVDLTRAAFKKYGGNDESWDSDTPAELLTTWDQFVEIFDRLS